MTSNRCITVRNTLDSSIMVNCACDLIQLFSVVIYPVRTVQKCDYRNFIQKGKIVRTEARQVIHHVYS